MPQIKKIMNKQLNEKINQIKNLIIDTKASLKSWANLIGKYHKQLQTLTQQLETIKQELTMNENNLKGDTH